MCAGALLVSMDIRMANTRMVEGRSRERKERKEEEEEADAAAE